MPQPTQMPLLAGHNGGLGGADDAADGLGAGGGGVVGGDVDDVAVGGGLGGDGGHVIAVS